jgi:hypothetical protein
LHAGRKVKVKCVADFSKKGKVNWLFRHCRIVRGWMKIFAQECQTVVCHLSICSFLREKFLLAVDGIRDIVGMCGSLLWQRKGVWSYARLRMSMGMKLYNFKCFEGCENYITLNVSRGMKLWTFEKFKGCETTQLWMFQGVWIYTTLNV